MKLIRVGAASLNQVPLDWEGNVARITQAIAQARERGVAILCLPELCITGYGCEDAFHADFVHEAAWAALEAITPLTKGMAVSLGLPVFHDGAVFNVAAFLCDGKLQGLVAKKFLAGDGIHYEPRWFKAWTGGVANELSRGNARVPFGDLHFDCGGVEIGFEICEEAWVSNRPGASLALRGVDVILNPSASHFAFGKLETRKRFVIEGSRAFGVVYVYSNLLGNESGRVIYDGGNLVASGGRLVAQGPRLGYSDVVLTVADVDVSLNRMNRSRAGSFRPDLRSDNPGAVRCDFALPPSPESAPSESPEAPPWEAARRVKEEEFTRAVALGLFDYLRKSRTRGFVVSLSGGADSTAVSCLSAAAVRFSCAELGLEGARAKLAHAPQAAASADERGMIKSLLACVYQPTENSSTTSREAARAVAGALGADYFEWEVGGITQSYVEAVAKAIGRSITWEADDLALQNIQARSRAPGVWLLANIRGALLLATSDRSEAAVGYATMDGDTCGGVSPIAGIDKAFLLRWLKWLELEGPLGLGPIPELAVVTAQSPTPELRPSALAQTAEGDLMPYPALDVIERAFIRDKRSPAEALAEVRRRFPKSAPSEHEAWVARFLRLWCQNQWKRERYAPSFHLDDQNLDPKTWCRFPILSSGLAAEIAALEKKP